MIRTLLGPDAAALPPARVRQCNVQNKHCNDQRCHLACRVFPELCPRSVSYTLRPSLPFDGGGGASKTLATLSELTTCVNVGGQYSEY